MLLDLLLGGCVAPILSQRTDTEDSLVSLMDKKIGEKSWTDFVFFSQISLSVRTLERYIKELQTFGYNVNCVNHCFSLSKLLQKKEFNTLVQCVMCNDTIDNNKKVQLVNKLSDKFQIGRY